MKKIIISLSFFVLGLGTFLWLYNYDLPMTYNLLRTVIEYFFYWFTALFISSLFAFILPNDKYKKWLKFTVVYAVVALLVAYIGRDPGSDWMSPDGEELTKIFAGLYSFFAIIYCIVYFFRNRKILNK